MSAQGSRTSLESDVRTALASAGIVVHLVAPATNDLGANHMVIIEGPPSGSVHDRVHSTLLALPQIQSVMTTPGSCIVHIEADE